MQKNGVKKGKLIIVSGPSGVGKGTVLTGMLAKRSDAVLAVSMTTRAPRSHEREGIDYFCFQ